MYKIGLDVGSTTIKAVVLNKNNDIIYKIYVRHLALVRQKAIEILTQINNHIIKNQQIQIAITGSAGLGIAQVANIPFVQEVFATQIATEKLIPNADVVIELGGEDAKILFLSNGIEVRMNGSCAGGTGAFIDQMATLLNVSLDELDQMSLNSKQIYTIASRCGVFAKSDIQPLLNQGANKNDISASIFKAVVNQTITGLAQGRKIKGNVAFLGGPLTFFKGLQKSFKDSLCLNDNNAIFPENSQYFIALGASFYSAKTEKNNLDELIKKIENHKNIREDNNIKPLFENENQYNNFIMRHNDASVEQYDIKKYIGNAYLGIDAGSTSTKVVLISNDKKILYQKYTSNKGNPVPIIKQALEEIYLTKNKDCIITSSAAIGYGEELIQNAFGIDFGLVETMAHYTAAKEFMSNVDFIIDIGGQDIKCFKIKNDAIDSIMLNEACSSGCGSFIESFAQTLGYSAQDISKKALYGEKPVDLGSRCTVFMNSSVKQAQKDGATVSDISAGLAISVVKNALYKVIRVVDKDSLGENIVVQGGTFLNDAILRAFEQELGKNVVRPNIAGLMGAYGAAIFAMNNKIENSSLITYDNLKSFYHKSRLTNCGLCGNNCNLTINQFENGKYISGNRCDRPLGVKNKLDIMNAYEYKLNYLLNLSKPKGHSKKIGIPFVLNMFENLPFWSEFFDNLGYDIVLSDLSSRKLYELGQNSIPSDTACYPAKLVHGHIENLISKNIDTIFYPCMPYNFDENLGDNNYNCPVVAYYPELINANMSNIKNITFINDYIGLHRKKDFAKKSYQIFSKYFNIDKKQIKNATDKAYLAQQKYIDYICDYGEKAIKFSKDNNLPLIVLAGRPYHIDPEINHGIDKLLLSLKTVVISEDCLINKFVKASTNVLNQWTYHSRLYSAAEYVSKNKNMNLIQMISFGCGIDSITGDEVRDILESNGKLYTQIKIDEINNLGAVKIRLRSLLAAIEQKKIGGN